MISTAVIHVHLVTEQNHHIPGATVHAFGFNAGFPYDATLSSGGAGVASFEVAPFGLIDLFFEVRTAGGDVERFHWSGNVDPIFNHDPTVVLVLANADSEGSSIADAKAWLGGLGGIEQTAVIVGGAVLVGVLGYFAYKAISGSETYRTVKERVKRG